MKSAPTKTNKNTKSVAFNNLPPEIILHCFSFLTSPKDLVSLSKANHELHRLALDRRFWEKFQKYSYHTTPRSKQIQTKLNAIGALKVFWNNYLKSNSIIMYI